MNQQALFKRNIGRAGRLFRGTVAAAILLAAFLAPMPSWAGAVIAVAGVFVLFEALRGWCLLRARGMKTRL